MGVRDISGAGTTDSRILETVQSDGTFEFQQATEISTTAGNLTLNPASNSTGVTGHLGVGTSSPGDYPDEKNNLVIYENANVGMSLISSGTGVASIAFGMDTSHTNKGWIDYNNNSKQMRLGTNGNNTAITIDSGQRVGLGIASPSDYVDEKNNFVLGATTGHTGMTIVSGNTAIGTIQFRGDTSVNNNEGWIDYSQNTQSMRFGTSGLNTALTLGNDQKATFAGDVQVTGDIILDDGGSLKEAGGTAAITFDGSGHVTKIGQDSPSSADVLTYDGSKWVASAPTTGDIEGVTAGTGLSGGGTSGTVTLNVDASQTHVTGVGTITAGTWQGTAIASAYLDADTAHLSGTQTFSGDKTFTSNVTATDASYYASKHDDDANPRAKIVIRKSRGTSGSPTVVADGHVLGAIDFEGYDGNSWATGATIEAKVSGTPGDADLPTQIEFGTTPDGAEDSVTRLTIQADGKCKFTEDILLDDGGSICEAGGTAAITIGATGEVTKIGQDTPSDAQVLTWDNTNTKVVWSDAAGGGDTTELHVQTDSGSDVSTPATVDADAGVVMCVSASGARYVQLPAVATDRRLFIKDKSGNAATNNITVKTNGSEEIDGSSSDLVLSTDWASVQIVSDGTKWYII